MEKSLSYGAVVSKAKKASASPRRFTDLGNCAEEDSNSSPRSVSADELSGVFILDTPESNISDHDDYENGDNDDNDGNDTNSDNENEEEEDADEDISSTDSVKFNNNVHSGTESSSSSANRSRTSSNRSYRTENSEKQTRNTLNRTDPPFKLGSEYNKRVSRSCGCINGMLPPPYILNAPLILQNNNLDDIKPPGFRFEPEFEPDLSEIPLVIPGFSPEQQFDKLMRIAANQNFAFTDDPRRQYQLVMPAVNHIGSPDVESTLLPICALCKEPCKERCYFAHGNSYHPLCFKCSRCHRHLRPPSCAFMLDLPYCLYCSRQQKQLNRCPVCGLFIVDPRDEIQPDCYNNPIHRTCLRCYSCSEGIGTDDYTLVSGKPVCEPCMSELSEKACKKCGKVILERSVEFHGMHFHPDHFICTQCHVPLRGMNYVVYRNKPYCPTHGDAFATRKCWACHGDFVDEDVIRWDGRAYHENCFKCKVCQTKLTQDNWVRVHGYTYCEKCYQSYRDAKATKFEKKMKEKKKPARRLKRQRKETL